MPLGVVPWPAPVPAPGASKVMTLGLCFQFACACGQAAKTKPVKKTISKMLMRFMFASMKIEFRSNWLIERSEGALASGGCCIPWREVLLREAGECTLRVQGF